MIGVARKALPWMVCLAMASLPCEATPGGEATLGEARALIDAGRYEEAEAVAEEYADGVLPEAHDPLNRALALDLWVESRWRNGKAWHPGTLEAAQRAMAIKAEVLGPVSAAFADSVFHQARVLDEWGKYEAARGLYLKAIDLYGRTTEVPDPRAQRAATYLGGLLVELGQLRAARPHLEAALKSLESTLGPDHPWVAEALVHLGWLEAYARNLEMGQQYFERALSILESRLTPIHPLVAEPLDGLSMVMRDLNDQPAAGSAARRAFRIRERTLRSDHPSLIPGLVYLWWVSDNEVEGTKAMEAARRVAEISYPQDHPLAAWALGYAAFEGDTAESWTMFEKAIEIMTAGYGAGHWRVAKHLGNLSFLMGAELGNPGRARELAARAFEINQAGEVGGSTGLSLDHYINMSLRLGSMGLEEAIETGERALAIAREERARWFHLASVLEGQARRLRLAGRTQVAIALAEEALGLRKDLVGPDHIHLNDSLRYVAELRADQGDFDTAFRLVRRALEICHAWWGENPDIETHNARELQAQLLWATGQPGEAARVAIRMERSWRGLIEPALLGFPETQSLRFRDAHPTGRDFFLSALALDPTSGFAAEAADAVIRSRSLVLDSIAERAALTKVQRDEETARLDQAVTDARARLAHLAVAGEPAGKADHTTPSIQAALLEKERAERALAAHSYRFRSQLEARSANLATTLSSLPEGSGVVSYVRFEFHELGDPDSPLWPPRKTPSYLAFVLRADRSTPQFIPLGPAATIDRSLAALREGVWSLAAAGDRAPALSLAEYRREGGALRSRLWDPVASALEGLDRVFLVPDGNLVLLNWGALPTTDERYLMEEERRLHYLSAERDLMGFEPDSTSSPTLLALGDPAFSEVGLFSALVPEDDEVLRMARVDLAAEGAVLRGSRANCASFSDMQFDDLPAAADELRSLSALWRRTHSSAAPRVLSRAAANEAAFKARAPATSVLHLATHGFYLGGECADESEQATELAHESPLVLSGLALAGANHRHAARPDEEDGILTAEEIATLDLQSVEWAVLSGCETGVGEPRAGEGVFGLRRAFQLAGARTVIMSLWPVDDAATRDWMAALYRHRFEDGESTIDSVRGASLDLLAARREAGLSTHPFYWAGFVAAGDWR